MSPVNEAAWILEPKGDLKRFTAAYNTPAEGEIVIEVGLAPFCMIFLLKLYG